VDEFTYRFKNKLLLQFLICFNNVSQLIQSINAPICWYPVKIVDTIIYSDSNNSINVQTFYDSYRKNTFGFGISLGSSFKLVELFSLIVSAEERFVNDLLLDQQNGPFETNFDGFF